jgi:hypothetical protein
VTEEVKAPRRRLPIVVAAVAVLAVGAIVLVAVLTSGDDSPPKGSIGTSPTTGVSTTASPNTSVAPATTPTTLTTGTTSATPSPTVAPATVPASEADFPNPASPPTTDAEWEAACGQLRALLQYADDADLRAAGVSLGCL